MCAEGVRKRTGQHEEPRTGGAGLGVEGIVCGGGVAGSDFMLGAAEWPANSVLQIIRCSWGMPHVVMTTVQPRRESRGAPPQLPESWVTWGSLALLRPWPLKDEGVFASAPVFAAAETPWN